MKKKSVKLLIACLLSCAGVASAAGAAGSVMSVKAASGVAENAPFYDGPMCSDKSSVTKRSDGSYAVSQTTGGGGKPGSFTAIMCPGARKMRTYSI